MFKFNTQCNPRQISLTGVRAIVLLALLSKKPRTFDEIRDFFISSNLVSKKYSMDTIRIDLNTLKYIGCEISKATKNTNNAFILKSHPFQLELDEDDLETLSKIYKGIHKNLSIDRLIEYDLLFKKLSESVKKVEIKEYLLGISALKGLNIELIKELYAYAKRKSKLYIEYNAGNTKFVKYDVTVEDVCFRNNKLYIYCYNHSLKKRTFLNISRIKKIITRYLHGENIETNDIIMQFKLNNYNEYVLEDNEKIIQQNNEFIIVEGNYYTEFIAIQRILSFGSDCIIISPDNIKNNIIDKLKNMRKLYD